MISFNETATINAPLEKVFAIVSEPKKIPLWRMDVPGITAVSEPMRAGTTFVEDVHFMGKKQLLMKVTEFVPGKKIVIEAQNGMSLLPTQSFVFSAEENKTKIELSVTMKVSGFFKLMEFMLPAQLKKKWEKYFENLNSLARN